MKVFIITTSSFPYGMADSKRVLCYAKAIVYAQCECEVVVYKRNLGFDNKQAKGTENNIPYRYMGSNPIRSRNRIVARLNDVIDRGRLFLYLVKKVRKGDVVFCYGSLYTNVLINVVHRKYACFVGNLTEYPFLSMRKDFFAKMYQRILLTKVFPKYDGIISISDALTSFAKEYTSSRCSYLNVPILVDYDIYNIDNLAEEESEKFIFHAGSLVENKDGILGMLEAFGLYRNRYGANIRFVCTGSVSQSPHKEEIERLIRQYKIGDCVYFTGYLNEEEYKDYLKRASLVIINKYVSLQNTYCFSTKLGEYMAAGKVIIITNVGEAMNWVSDERDVFVVQPKDTEGLVEKMKYVFSNKGLRIQVSNQARITCENSFDYRKYGSTLVKYFSQLISSSIVKV